MFFWFKVLLSGLIIAAVSTLAKSTPKWAAFLTALPLVTFLSLIWIYWENRNLDLVATYTQDVLLWTLPGLLFFVAAIFLFRAKIPFAVSMVLATMALALGVFLFEKLKWIK